MKCAECESDSTTYLGLDEYDRSQLRCTDCGFYWSHEPSPEGLRKGIAGGQKHHCPVCAEIYADPMTPIITIGSPNNLAHRCDRTKCFHLGTTYGLANAAAIDAILAATPDTKLTNWPRVLEMKQERLGEATT